MNDPESSRPVTVAFLGGGNRAVKYLKYILDNPSKAKTVGIVEPNPIRLDRFAQLAAIPAECCFESADDFFAHEPFAEAVVICTPDATHYDYSMEALRRGYHILLEKPVARSLQECEDIAALAHEKGLIVSVCHVLRYHPYFAKIKEIIDSGELGRVVAVNHSESIGVDRSCHCYVRGGWRREDTASPMILTKFCHDADLVAWWSGSRMARIQSYGSLRWFTEANAPEGSARRCVDCKVEASCPYSAVDLYRNRREWIANFDIAAGEKIGDAIERQLSVGPYGRCVFHCDNNVVDRQLIAMEMENGVTVNMAMDLFTHDDNRTTHICLTHGEIYGDESRLHIVKFRGAQKRDYDFSQTRKQPYHAGADFHVVDDFINSINGSMPGHKPVSNLDDIIESHRICLAAEHSRIR